MRFYVVFNIIYFRVSYYTNEKLLCFCSSDQVNVYGRAVKRALRSKGNLGYYCAKIFHLRCDKVLDENKKNNRKETKDKKTIIKFYNVTINQKKSKFLVRNFVCVFFFFPTCQRGRALPRGERYKGGWC